MRKPPKQRRPAPRPRNWLAVLAHRRHGGPMKDRREPRRGAGSWRALLAAEGGEPEDA